MRYKYSGTAAGVIYIVLGLLCIIFRSGLINFAAFCGGIALIVFGILFLVKERIVPGTIMLISGIAFIMIGYFMISVIFYLIAALMIAFGINRLVIFMKNKAVNDNIFRPEALRAILLIVCGVVFLFNQKGTVSVVFIVVGIVLLVNGILVLVESN